MQQKIKDLTYGRLQEVVLNKGYKFFKGNYNMNLVGVRTSNKITNKFEDYLLLAYQENGEDKLIVFDNFTTRPGFKWMVTRLLNRKGCAVVLEGQHRGIWKMGFHKGKYRALVQRGDEITIGRDKNKNKIIDNLKNDTGYFGINCHHAYGAKTVGPYSAGCQVHQHPKDLIDMLEILEDQIKYRKSRTFSYTLININDL